MKTTENKIESEFKKLRKRKQYVILGWFFWDGFLFTKGKIRKVYRKLWQSLSRKEKTMCESV